MNIIVPLQRVVSLQMYTLVCCIVVPCFIVFMYNWTQCQDALLYGFDPRTEKDRHVVFLGTTKNEKPGQTSQVVKKKKTILYWTKMFNSKNFYLGDGDVFAGCPVWSCMGTDNHKYQSVDKFDAILFHGPEFNAENLPKKRSPHQRYIFMDSETQVFHPIVNNTKFYNFFNWTMTYRRDSDIMRPYGAFRNISSNHILPPYIPAQWVDVSGGVVPESARLSFQSKTKISAWFVSHCETQSKREDIAKKLKKFVTVDIYGNYGEFKCPRSKEIECYEKLESDYFFYLSFENSMCRDYLTEKIFTVLDYDVIPIVYGAADYDSFLPPNSYINVQDFTSVEALAEFLVELSQDEERYLSYFKWKSFYKPLDKTAYIVCEFCKALHEPHWPNQVIGDIYEWWVKGSECIEPPAIS